MTALIVLSALLGCSAPVEAPAELGELSLYLYENFNGEGEDGPEALVAGAAELETWLLNLDLDGDTDDRAFTPPILPTSRLGGAVGPANADPELQVPVILGARSDYDMDTQREIMLDPNQVCISSPNTVYQAQTFLTDLECFRDGSCDRLETEHEILIEGLSDVWLDVVQHYVRVALDDGREVIFARVWMPEQAFSHTSDTTWDQRYALSAWIAEDSGSVLRFYGLWSSLTSAALTDDLYATIVKNGIADHFAHIEAFAAGEDCDLDRDRPHDRE